MNYPQTCNMRRTLVGNKTADHSAPVGAAPTTSSTDAPTTSSFST